MIIKRTFILFVFILKDVIYLKVASSKTSSFRTTNAITKPLNHQHNPNPLTRNLSQLRKKGNDKFYASRKNENKEFGLHLASKKYRTGGEKRIMADINSYKNDKNNINKNDDDKEKDKDDEKKDKDEEKKEDIKDDKEEKKENDNEDDKDKDDEDDEKDKDEEKKEDKDEDKEEEKEKEKNEDKEEEKEKNDNNDKEKEEDNEKDQKEEIEDNGEEEEKVKNDGNDKEKEDENEKEEKEDEDKEEEKEKENEDNNDKEKEDENEKEEKEGENTEEEKKEKEDDEGESENSDKETDNEKEDEEVDEVGEDKEEEENDKEKEDKEDDEGESENSDKETDNEKEDEEVDEVGEDKEEEDNEKEDNNDKEKEDDNEEEEKEDEDNEEEEKEGEDDEGESENSDKENDNEKEDEEVYEEVDGEADGDEEETNSPTKLATLFPTTSPTSSPTMSPTMKLTLEPSFPLQTTEDPTSLSANTAVNNNNEQIVVSPMPPFGLSFLTTIESLTEYDKESLFLDAVENHLNNEFKNSLPEDATIQDISLSFSTTTNRHRRNLLASDANKLRSMLEVFATSANDSNNQLYLHKYSFYGSVTFTASPTTHFDYLTLPLGVTLRSFNEEGLYDFKSYLQENSIIDVITVKFNLVSTNAQQEQQTETETASTPTTVQSSSAEDNNSSSTYSLLSVITKVTIAAVCIFVILCIYFMCTRYFQCCRKSAKDNNIASYRSYPSVNRSDNIHSSFKDDVSLFPSVSMGSYFYSNKSKDSSKPKSLKDRVVSGSTQKTSATSNNDMIGHIVFDDQVGNENKNKDDYSESNNSSDNDYSLPPRRSQRKDISMMVPDDEESCNDSYIVSQSEGLDHDNYSQISFSEYYNHDTGGAAETTTSSVTNPACITSWKANINRESTSGKSTTTTTTTTTTNANASSQRDNSIKDNLKAKYVNNDTDTGKNNNESGISSQGDQQSNDIFPVFDQW